MATAEQTANGVAAPAEAAQPIPSAAQDPTTSQSAAPLAASDTPMETPTATEGAAVEVVVAQTEAAVPEPLPEPYTSLFKQAKEAPTEFNTWTSLITAAEKLGDIGRIRPVYDAFLAEYPLCYGYWKKYADAEAKYVSMQEASVVYDRGVAAVPYSVDLWGHYAMHKQKAGSPVEEVERLFERGLAYVGMDYLSHGLWDKYLAYELGLGAHATVAQLYLRLLRMPIQRLDEYRTRFHEYAAQHSTAELISEQERQEFAASIAKKMKEEQAALAQKLQEEQAAQAAAAQAAQVAAELSAATAAQAVGNTDAAQAMDTTAEGDDVVDAVGQATVAAAGHMVSDIAAPAAATIADSSAVDDAPPAEAAPNGTPATGTPSVLAVPTPDEIAATVMADPAAQAAAAVPTATAPSTAPVPVNSALPLSAPPASTALAPPQDVPSEQTPAATADTDMPQATIPQSDGPGDDPMQDVEAALDAAQAQVQPAAASSEPSPAASFGSVTTGYTGSAAVPAPAAAAEAAGTAADGQAAAATASGAQQAPTQATAAGAQPAAAAPTAAPVASEDAVAEEQIKAAWLASIDEVWRSTKEEWERRKPFEDAIKRPYFHVKPLDMAQLQNWSRYLDYIEEKKDIGMIIRLYERCLVACASYPDLWMRYVRWQEGSSKAAAQVALERATSVHCKRRPEIQLFAAHFHERHGHMDMARALFKLVTDRLSPALISGAVQHANFERRQGNKAAACSVYDKFLQREAGKGTATYAFMVIQYINALQWGFEDSAKAREVYSAAIKKAPDSLTLWEGIIHFEETLPGPDRITRVLDIYDRAVAPAQPDSPKPNGVAVATDASATSDATQDATAVVAASDKPAEAAAQRLTDSERELLSLRAVDFVDAHGDASLWSKVESQHAQRFKLPGKVATSPAASRKRLLAEAADASASKAAKTAAAATPAAAVAAYAGAATLPGPPAAGAQASAAMSGYYPSATPYYQYPQGYAAAQQPYAYPAASAAAAPAYQYQGYYG